MPTAATTSSKPREAVACSCHAARQEERLVVGDRVRWQLRATEASIEAVEPRRNLLFRQDEWRTKTFAANLDQLLVLVAARTVFSESQLARALIAAESAGIPARIVLNKTDLPQADAARERLAPYRAMGVEVLELALKARSDRRARAADAAAARPGDAGARARAARARAR